LLELLLLELLEREDDELDDRLELLELRLLELLDETEAVLNDEEELLEEDTANSNAT